MKAGVLRLLALAVLTGCQFPTAQNAKGSLKFTVVFPEQKAENMRIQAIPANTQVIAVAVFRQQNQLEAGLVLTPAQPKRRLGLLPTGQLRIVALAFDAAGQALAGDSGSALITAGQTSQAELDLQPQFEISAQEQSLLRALLQMPVPSISPSVSPSATPSPGGSSGSLSIPALIQSEPPVILEVSPSPSAPQPSPSRSSGGGGGGTHSESQNGGDLGADINLQPGQTSLPPIIAGVRP